jgi:hypothetical protein
MQRTMGNPEGKEYIKKSKHSNIIKVNFLIFNRVVPMFIIPYTIVVLLGNIKGKLYYKRWEYILPFLGPIW